MKTATVLLALSSIPALVMSSPPRNLRGGSNDHDSVSPTSSSSILNEVDATTSINPIDQRRLTTPDIAKCTDAATKKLAQNPPSGYAFRSATDTAAKSGMEQHENGLTLQQLVTKCSKDAKCVGFNSNKWYATTDTWRPDTFLTRNNEGDCFGFFQSIKAVCTDSDIKKLATTDIPSGYKFRYLMDTEDADTTKNAAQQMSGKTLKEIATKCSDDAKCVGFNTNKYYVTTDDWKKDFFKLRTDGGYCFGFFEKISSDSPASSPTTAAPSAAPTSSNSFSSLFSNNYVMYAGGFFVVVGLLYVLMGDSSGSKQQDNL